MTMHLDGHVENPLVDAIAEFVRYKKLAHIREKKIKEIVKLTQGLASNKRWNNDTPEKKLVARYVRDVWGVVGDKYFKNRKGA